MKKLLIILCCLFISQTAYSQIALVGFGGTVKRHFAVSIGYINQSNIQFKFNGNLSVYPGYEGEKYTNISWNKYPEDIKSKGNYFNSYDFVIGYKFDNIIISGIVGIAQETEFQNRDDRFNILGNDGKYYITRTGAMRANYGAEIGFKFNKIIISINSTKTTYFGAILHATF